MHLTLTEDHELEELSTAGCYGKIYFYGDYVVKTDTRYTDRESSSRFVDRELEEECEAQMEAARFGIAPKSYGLVDVTDKHNHMWGGILMDRVYGFQIKHFNSYWNGYKIHSKKSWLRGVKSLLNIADAFDAGCPPHADMNTGNFIVQPSGKIYLIDWGRTSVNRGVFEKYYEHTLILRAELLNSACVWNSRPFPGLNEIRDLYDLDDLYEEVKAGYLG